MTIPLRPGPFSFLSTLGEAGGKAFDAAQKEKDKRLKQAQDRLNQMLQLRAAGLIDPSAFSSPEAMTLYEELKILPVSSEKTSGERVEDIKRKGLAPNRGGFTLPISSLIPGASDVQVPPSGMESLSDDERAAAGFQSRGATAEDQLRGQLAGRKSAILAKGTPEQQAAVSGVPTELTARAGEESARDTLNNSLALRSVDAAITRSGGTLEKIIGVQGGVQALAEAAWQTAQQDAKMRGYTAVEELTRPYIEAAISSRVRESQKLAVERLAAQNRGMSGQDTLGDYLRLLQGQQAMTRQQLSALPKPSDEVIRMATIYQASIDKAITPEDRLKVEKDPKYSIMRQGWDVIQNYKETQLQLNNELNGYRDQLQNLLGGITGAGPATPGREGRKLSDARVDEIVQRMRERGIGAEQLDVDVKAGVLSAADAAVIKSRLTQGAAQTVKP
jgi:hypothetical protein